MLVKTNVFFAILLLVFPTFQIAVGAEDARLMRYPHINSQQVVFVYAGDIWTVPAQGGDARQLTTHKGLELFPKLSPDGQWVAFSAEYSGSRQIYVMPATGGTPRQLTWYNDVGPMPQRGGFDNIPLDWTADSKQILFRSNRTEYGDRMSRYFLVAIEGGFEQPLPIPYGGFGVLSPDNKQMAFTFPDREFRTWKRYKGGRASNIWTYDLENNQSQQITDWEGTDHIPHWHGNAIYYASDRDTWLNIYKFDLNTRETRQLTFHNDFDVMWPAGTGNQLVYECGGRLFRLNLDTETTEQLSVNIRYDFTNTLPYHKNVKDRIHSSAISPSGSRVVFDARGELFSVPAGSGTTFNITQTPAAREIFPQWSPDGKWIAYYSDASGEYEVYLLENKEGASPRQVTHQSKGWKYQSEWSPDSRYLLYFDRSMKLQLLDVESGKVDVVDTPTSDEIRHYTFSPDSKWITYTKASENGQGSVWVYQIDNQQRTQLTDDTFGDRTPVFSKDGHYLYFLSNRDFNLAFSDFEFSYLYNRATRIYALHLTNDSPRLFEPKETLETTGTDKDDEKDKGQDAADNVRIDFNGANSRIVAFPLPAGSYWGLQAVKDGIVYFTDAGMQHYNVKDQTSKTIMEGIRSAIISADGSKFLYQQRGDYGVASLSPNQKAGEGKLDLSDMSLRIDPRQEWQQIFADGWRIFRDYFYVSNLHNVDWDAFRTRYEALLPFLNHRFDLDYIFGEMVAETNAGHAYVDYGDFERVDRVQTGLLGAELTEDQRNQRYIISKIYQGENWNSSRISPLTMQGIDISEGDYLISIEGTDITTSLNPYRFLENRVGKATRITVNDKPTAVGARTYTIMPIGSEQELKYLDWVNTRRAMVDKLSEGRIGYIHVPNTSADGNRELFRGMYAYHHKDALIIDERFNGGGFIPDRMTEILLRETHALWHVAGLDPMKTPRVAHDGPKAMLINQYSASGGDAFPHFFRQRNLGTIIGTRTWGGLVGISGNARLSDGGYIAVPRFGIYNADGEWIIEGIGVYPDIEVVDEPHRVAQGEDPSLEKAIEVLLEQLEENPPVKWQTPTDPDRSKWIERH